MVWIWEIPKKNTEIHACLVLTNASPSPPPSPPIFQEISHMKDVKDESMSPFFKSARRITNCRAAGPESLVNYFQKVALLGQNFLLNLCYVETRPNSRKLYPSIWRSVIFGLWNLKKKYVWLHFLFTQFNCLFSVVNI